jgi:DNA polymerase-2
MNSFYGVLGVPGARFASGFVAGAITSFGHHLLHWCRDYFTRTGHRVIYGDTDSLFVLSDFPMNTASENMLAKAREICGSINGDLRRYVRDRYGVESFLDLEFEKLYYRFFLPPVRTTMQAGSIQSRGRAKGYAGLLIPAAELLHASSHEGTLSCIEVRGMEAVRRDWTDLARGFQIGLLQLVFMGMETDDIRGFIRRTVDELHTGKLDAQLVYTKALRKPIRAYERSKPPHVRAASMLAPEEQRGLIRYIWTLDGPQPVNRISSPVDYDHYVEKQIRPIAQSFVEVLHTDIKRLFGEEEQLMLF